MSLIFEQILPGGAPTTISAVTNNRPYFSRFWWFSQSIRANPDSSKEYRGSWEHLTDQVKFLSHMVRRQCSKSDAVFLINLVVILMVGVGLDSGVVIY